MRFFLFFLFTLLAACARDTTVTDDVFTGVHNDITELAQQLPKECKTPATMAKIDALSARVSLAEKSCNKDISDCRADARRWRFRFWGLVIGIGAILGLAIWKKVLSKIL